MKGYLQVNATDGLGNKTYTYHQRCFLSTVNGMVELCLMNHTEVYYEDSKVVKGWKDLNMSFKATTIEFCDVGIFIENHDKSISIIFSENDNGAIAQCAKSKSK